MSSVKPLPVEELRRCCDPDRFSFDTTADLPELDLTIGQERPTSAIRFGVRMERQGYNIFALGPAGLGKYTLVRKAAEERAATEVPPSDWCYVNNFEQPYRPKALRLPTGLGREFKRDVERLVDDMQNALSAAFESEEYQARRRAVEGEFQDQQQASLMQLQEEARQRSLALLRTPAGLAFAPTKDGNVLPPEEYEKLPEEDQHRIQADVEVMQEQLQKILAQAPRWERELRHRLRDLNREVAGVVLADLIEELAAKYKELPDVLAHLEAVQRDVNEHLGDFLIASEKRHETADGDGSAAFAERLSPLRRYQVNLLIDSADITGAPVIYESNPIYLNLTGRVEQMAQMGALVTDFMLIKPGTLHRANGGYLILDALKVLVNPYAWEGLKRALQFGEIRIESAVQMLSLTSTISLEPEPIPLDIKVVLLGDRMLYYLLSNADPDFNELFKVAADFANEIERTEETQEMYAQLIATIVRKEKLRHLDRQAVAAVIDHAARLVSDSERLTAQIQAIVDLLGEANYWAEETGADLIRAEHIQQAIDAQIFRLDRVARLIQEQVLRNTVHIDTRGEVIGQINGLSVLQLGNYPSGQASRITASVRMGRGDVVNIEREVNMSGPIHSKGVLILASFLNARYAIDRPLALSASLVFEQSYGGVDGDSASSAELYVLFSAIGRIPIKQSLAVTGSVDQHGRVQAIGGVNEKIEGFFDLCKARGLTGDQGVIIPATNVKNLMLRQDVVDAVAEGKFHIYPVEHVDQGIEILTGIPAGERNRRGLYPRTSVNRMVEDRLADIMKKRQKYDEQTRRSRRGSGLGGKEDDKPVTPQGEDHG
ncbi:MAG: AAA family ATPase [Caldilineaceae bacterium]|nr:AAA family ATPase [Caldilineaceae bacterium]